MFLNRVFAIFLLFINVVTFSQGKMVKKTVKVNTLDEVIITATRTVRQLSSLPMPVTLISKKQIQKTGSTRLKDILLEQTGINFVTNQSGFTGIQMQGLVAEYTMIMIDGVPLIGRTSGNLDLNRITVNNIKQIEIAKGPSSSLYGSEALGGVINIITEKPKKNTLKGVIESFIRAGSRDELDVNTNFLYKKEKFGIVAGLNLNSSEGYDLSPETSFKTAYPHQNYTGNLQLSYDFSDKLTALISNRIYIQNQNTPTSENKQTDWNINGKVTHKISDLWNIDYTFYGTRFKTEGIFNEKNSLFNRSLFRPEIRTKIDIDKSNIVLGIGGNFDALERTSFDGIKKHKAQYIYGQYDFYPIKNLNVIVGARFDSHNEYKSAFSPKLSSSYKVNNWLMAKASVGYGFKVPNFRQLYFNFRNSTEGYIVLGTQTIHDLYPNVLGINNIQKELKPENSIGYNFGFQLNPLSNLKININLFSNNIQDLIDSFDTQLKPLDLGLPNGTRTFSYRNINKVYTQGVEIEANYKVNDNFKLLAGYQFLGTGDKEQENRIKNGEIFFTRTPTSPSKKLTISNYFGLPNRSKHTANVKLFYENFEHVFSVNIRGVYRSKYALFDTNNSQGIIDRYDKFVTDNLQINLSAEKTFYDLINIQIGIDNALNEKGLENKEIFANNDSVLRIGSTIYSRITFNF